MYNYEHCDWIKRSKLDWGNERNESSVSIMNGYSRSDYNGNMMICSQNNSNNLSYEYGCGEKNGCYNDNYSGNDYRIGNYSTYYHQSCQDEEWLTNSNSCASEYNYPYSTHYNHHHHHHNQQSSQQRNAYWIKPHQIQMSTGTVMSNYQQNNPGTSFNVTTATADPLNALQNLTVSAGQSAQIMAAQQNMRLNSTAYNNQIRQRPLVQGSINRPMDPMSATKSSLSQQLVQSQIPSNVISNSNIVNASNPRMSSNPIAIKTEMCVNQNPGQQSLMLPPYPMDSCNSMMNNPQTVPMSSAAKIAQYNPLPASQYQASKDPFTMSTQQSSLVMQQSNNNLYSNTAPIKRTINAQPSSRPQMNIITEEEAKKVKEEVKKLKDKYFKKLSLILENPKNVSEEEIKVWTVLRNLLENPESIQKPLSLRHISKIEQHLLKAEQQLQKNSSQPTNIHLEQLHPNTSQTAAQIQCLNPSRTNISKPVGGFDEKSMKKSLYPLSDSSNENTDANNGSINSSSLDIAFDDVCHQLTNTDNKIVKRVQQSLIEYVKSRQSQYRHFLPKRVFIDLDEESIGDGIKSKMIKLESVEEEFDTLEKYENDDAELFVNKDSSISFIDENRLLRSDLNFSNIDMSSCNLEKELKILEHEFQVIKIEEEQKSKDWFSYDSDWADSQFYSFLYTYKSLPSIVPPIKVRISPDYEDSGCTDWHLNLELYQLPFDDFLNEVASLLTTNFTEAHHNYQWSGIPLLYIMSLYKRSILLAHANYTNRLIDEN